MAAERPASDASDVADSSSPTPSRPAAGVPRASSAGDGSRRAEPLARSRRQVITHGVRVHAASWWRWAIRLAVVGVFLAGLLGDSFRLQGALTLVAYPAAIAVSYSLVLGHINLLNFSWQAVVGFGAYSFAIAEAHAHVGAVTAVLLVICFDAAFAFIVAVPSLWLGGFEFALATVGIGALFSSALLAFSSLTGGSSGAAVLANVFPYGVLDARRGLMIAIGVLAVACLCVWFTIAGRSGRLLAAVGDDEYLARSLGRRVGAVRLGASAWAGALTGLVSSFAVQQNQVALPDGYGLSLLIQLFLVLIVGGRRSIWGPIAGSLLVVGIPAYVEGINGNVLTIAFGLLVVATVIARPAGMYEPPVHDRIGPVARLQKLFVRQAPESALRDDEAVMHQPSDLVGVRVRGATKRFGAVVALSDVEMSAGAGEALGIVGSNGSGKTTLLNCLNGVWRLASGSIEWMRRDGEVEVGQMSSSRLARRGLGRSFQTPRVFEGLSVMDNLLIASTDVISGPARRRAEDALRHWDLERWLDWDIKTLPHGARRWLELARLDVSGATVLLLDEPAAGLTDEEIERLVAAVERWKRQGRCLILVEHNHQFVKAVCETTIVMASGSVLGIGDLEELRRDEEIRAVIGDRLD